MDMILIFPRSDVCQVTVMGVDGSIHRSEITQTKHLDSLIARLMQEFKTDRSFLWMEKLCRWSVYVAGRGIFFVKNLKEWYE